MPPASKTVGARYPVTPDGRYFVVRGRLWRMANRALPDEQRQHLVKELMAARRAVAQACKKGDGEAQAQVHAQVEQTKIALGERGPVWWEDGAPDYNRHMARNAPYAPWFAAQGTHAGDPSA